MSWNFLKIGLGSLFSTGRGARVRVIAENPPRTPLAAIAGEDPGHEATAAIMRGM